MQRFYEIDSLRGIAIIAMIAFHALYDLNYFAGYSFPLSQGAFFFLGRFAAATFVFLVGLSLTISYSRFLPSRPAFKKYFFRGLKIFSLGLLITAFTLLFFSQKIIWFGILHLIGLSIMLSYPLVKRPRESLVLGTAIIAVGLYIQTLYFPFPWLLWLGLKPFGFSSFDYAPLLPWLGIALFGIFAGNMLYPKGGRGFPLPETRAAPIRLLSFLGRNSLIIYFLHQPILVVAVRLLA